MRRDYLEIKDGNFEVVSIERLVGYFQYNNHGVLDEIKRRIPRLQDFDKMVCYTVLEMKDELLEVFSDIENQFLDVYIKIFNHFKIKEDFELIKKLYDLTDEEDEQQCFIRIALEKMNIESPTFIWALELFDPNSIFEPIDICFLIYKSREDIQGFIKIAEKVNQLIEPENRELLTVLLENDTDECLHSGYYPLYVYLFNLPAKGS